MGRLVWSNAKDAPRGFTHWKLLAARLGLFTILFGIWAYGMLTYKPETYMLGLLGIYAIISIYIGLLFSKTHIGSLRDLLIIWEDKVFLQRDDDFGWCVIPRDRFKVRVFAYTPSENLDDPARPPRIVLEEPYKGKIYFPFSYELTVPKIGGVRKVMVREKDIRELIDVLKPTIVFDDSYKLTEGYSYVIANFGEDLRAIAEEILQKDLKGLVYKVFGEKYCYVNGKKRFYRDVAIYVLDCTLAALSLYGLKSEAEKFMRCVLNGQIEEYLKTLDFEMVKKWSDAYSTISSTCLHIFGLIGFLAVALTFLAMLFGPTTFWMFALIGISVLMNGLRYGFFGYNGLVGDVKRRYFLGLFTGLFIDVFLSVVHVLIPFIAVFLSPGAFILKFPYIHTYITFSLIVSSNGILRNIIDTNYIFYRKLVEKWLGFSRNL